MAKNKNVVVEVKDKTKIIIKVFVNANAEDIADWILKLNDTLPNEFRMRSAKRTIRGKGVYTLENTRQLFGLTISMFYK